MLKHGIFAGAALLMIPAVLAIGLPTGISGAIALPNQITVELVSHSSQTSQARSACQADGATVATAMAAFEDVNHGKFPTMSDLTSSTHGGPYLQSAPSNPAYYRFTIVAGGFLKVASVKSLGPPITYNTPVRYVGPSSCANI